MWCSTPCNAEYPTQSTSTLQHTLFVLGLSLCVYVSASGLSWVHASQSAAPVSSAQAASKTTDSHPQLVGSRLQGEALMRYWGMRIYRAQLWTLPNFKPNEATEHPLLLELEYLISLKGHAIAETSIQEMRRAGKFSEAQAQRWLTEMQRVFPNINPGDRLTGLLMPGQGARFWHNGRDTGQVSDPEFAKLFFAIWLAPTTSAPQLRSGLLGIPPAANPPPSKEL